jgi:hypothetical protein
MLMTIGICSSLQGGLLGTLQSTQFILQTNSLKNTFPLVLVLMFQLYVPLSTLRIALTVLGDSMNQVIKISNPDEADFRNFLNIIPNANTVVNVFFEILE